MPTFTRPSKAIIITDGPDFTWVLMLLAVGGVAAVAAAVVVWMLAHALIITGLAAAATVAAVEVCAWLYRRHMVMYWRTTLPVQQRQRRRVRALPAPPKALEGRVVQGRSQMAISARMTATPVTNTHASASTGRSHHGRPATGRGARSGSA